MSALIGALRTPMGSSLRKPVGRRLSAAMNQVRAMFAANEQGVWFDPSDFERYMASKGPELVTNGTFDTDASGWTANLSTLTRTSDGWIKVAATGSANAQGTQSIATSTVGRWVEISASYRNLSAGRIAKLALYTTSDIAAQSSSSSSGLLRSVGYLPANTAAVVILLLTNAPVLGESVEWDNVSIRELTALNTATLFQDSAGTTPVTAMEQPVGLMLDKRLGLVRGAELVTNGDFSNGSTGFTLGAGAVVANGLLSQPTSGAGFSYQTISTQAGKTYEVTFTVVSGSFFAGAWDTAPTSTALVGATTYSVGSGRFVFIAADAGSTFSFTGNHVSATNTIDNISVKELPGNHATQATAASRPVLSARKNLCTGTEGTLATAPWVPVALTGTLQPDGSSLIARTSTVSNAYTSHTITLPVGTTFTYTMKMRQADVGVFYGLRLQSTYPDRVDAVFNLSTGTVAFVAGVSYTNASATISTPDAEGFYTCSVTAIVGGTAAVQAIHGPAKGALASWEASSTTLINGYVKEPQIEVSPIATRYQRVTTSTDYDSVGFPHYLKFDGVDDGMATAAINFTTTDKVTVWAGVRKLSDAAIGLLLEHGEGSAPVFAVFAPLNTGTGHYAVRSGATTTSVTTTASGYVAPVSSVLTMVADIVADTLRMHVDGVIGPTNTGDQGIGNYGNLPLYIGRRAGTSLPFSGHLYGLTIRGAASTAAQIASVERATAAKTGVTL